MCFNGKFMIWGRSNLQNKEKDFNVKVEMKNSKLKKI